MYVAEARVVIDRPQDEVFDYLADFTHLSVYDDYITASGPVGDGPPGVGTRGWGRTRFMGKQFDWVNEYVAFDRPDRMVSHTVEGTRDLTATFTLQPTDAGTLVTERIEIAGKMGGLMDKLPERLANRLLTRSLHGTLKTLAKVLAAERSHA